jgi:hypothetical protein
VSSDGSREDAHQWNGDIRDNIWYGYSENFSIHIAKIPKIWERATKFLIL